MRNTFHWRELLPNRLSIAIMGAVLGDHRMSSVKRDRPIPLMNVLPKVWLGMQCPSCKMVFALPPIGAPSGVKVMEALREELERHVLQSHIDLPSCSGN
jgi:hypothetical protein